MSCMKCGKEVLEDQVFCEECLLEMEKYPIKPGAPLLLPNRPVEPPPHKRTRRKVRKPEEIIHALKNRATFLFVLCCLLLVALVLSVLLNLQLLGNQNIKLLPRQNTPITQTQP